MSRLIKNNVNLKFKCLYALEYGTLKNDVTIGILENGEECILLEDGIYIYGKKSGIFNILRDLDKGKKKAIKDFEDFKLDNYIKFIEY